MAGLIYLISCPSSRVKPAAYLDFFRSKALVQETNPTLMLSGDEETLVYATLFTELLKVQVVVQNFRWDRMHTDKRQSIKPQVPGAVLHNTPEFGAETREEYMGRLREEMEPQFGVVIVALVSQTVMDDVAALRGMEPGIALMVVCKDSPNNSARIRSFVNLMAFQQFSQQNSIDRPHGPESSHKEAVWAHLAEMKEAIVSGLREELQSSPRVSDSSVLLRSIEGRLSEEVKRVASRIEETQLKGMQQIQDQAMQMVADAKSQFDYSRDQLIGGFQALRREQAEVFKALNDLQRVIAASQSPFDPRKLLARISQYEEVNGIVQEQLLSLQDAGPAVNPSPNPSQNLPNPPNPSPNPPNPLRPPGSAFSGSSNPSFPPHIPPRSDAPSFGMNLLLSKKSTEIDATILESTELIEIKVKNHEKITIEGAVLILATPEEKTIMNNLRLPSGSSTFQISINCIPETATDLSFFLSKDGVQICEHLKLQVEGEDKPNNPVQQPIPDGKSQPKPGFVPGANPGLVPDVKPGFVPGARPGFTSDAKPGVVPDVKPGFVPGARPGFTSDAKPGVVADVKPGLVPGAKPGPLELPKVGILKPTGPSFPFGGPGKPGPLVSSNDTSSTPSGLKKPAALNPILSGPTFAKSGPIGLKSIDDATPEQVRRVNEVVAIMGSAIKPQVRDLITKLVKDPKNANMTKDAILDLVYSQQNQ